VYETFFRLEHPPFGMTPDPRFLLRARVHHEALTALLFGLASDKGLMAVIGDVGTGKTTLCRALLEELPAGVEAALILNPYLSGVELLGAILDDLGVPRQGSTQGELMAALGAHLLEAAAAGRQVVVLLDEAQHLSVDALEQIRVLSTLEAPGRKLLQVILIGQPELSARLERPELRQLDQRLAIRCHLRPLTDKETARYVEHRMRVAGLSGTLPFTRGALRAVWEATRGVPRLINLICDRALATAYQARAEEITPAFVKAAARSLRGGRRRGWARRSAQLADAVTVAAGVLAAVLLGGATVQALRHGWPLPVVSLFTGDAFPVRAARPSLGSHGSAAASIPSAPLSGTSAGSAPDDAGRP
jgi:general secretion pathway protein A